MKLLPGSRGLAVSVVVAVALPVATAAFATDTEHSATGGSLLITNNTQLNAFPHLALSRDAFVEITSGYTGYSGIAQAGSGSGAARASVHSGDAAWVFRANDGVTGSRLMQYAWGGTSQYPGVHPTVNSVFFREGTMFDVDYAMGSNGGGFSVGGSLSLLKLEADEELDAPADLTNTGFSVRGSWGNGDGQNVAGELTYQKPEIEGVGDTEIPEDWVFDSWLAATVMYQGQLSGWVLNAAAFLMSMGDNEFLGRELDSAIGLLASFGRMLVADGGNEVGAELYLEYLSNNWLGFDGQSFVPADAIVVPGMRLGVTHELGGAFHIMAGAHAAWQNRSFSAEDIGGDDDRSERYFIYDYTLGLGATWGRVTVDTQVHPESIPTIVSLGNDARVLAQLSVEVALGQPDNDSPDGAGGREGPPGFPRVESEPPLGATPRGNTAPTPAGAAAPVRT